VTSNKRLAEINVAFTRSQYFYAPAPTPAQSSWTSPQEGGNGFKIKAARVGAP